MTTNKSYGHVILGDPAAMDQSFDRWSRQRVDETRVDETRDSDPRETTIGKTVSVTGPGTFFGRAQRTLTFVPADSGGWRFDRQDLPGSMPISVSAENIWTTIRNIVLSSGAPQNYVRMVEHIVALKPGLNVDHVLIRLDSGDPPLFERSSMDLVEAFDAAGVVRLERPARYVTVKEPVTGMGPGGSFLTFLPAEEGSRELTLDCAVDFKTAIGRQRLQWVVTPETFRYGAAARTNTTFLMMLYCKTIGKVFADVRHLGYTRRNILIAGRRRYFNRPGLIHEGKSLEAVWHRAALDLLAAVALLGGVRFAGRILSYKAGHALDCGMVRALIDGNHLVPVM